MKTHKIKSYLISLFILLTVSLTTYSSFAQGVISGGGGGDFDLALFWSYVHDIKTNLTPERVQSNLLTREDLEKLKEIMTPQQTNVKMQDEPLFILNDKGERISVGAVNIPDKKEILLHRPTWRNHYLSRLEIRHLILHEFLGLREIDDTGYRISQKVFYPVRPVLQFEETEAGCSIHTWVMLKMKDSIEFRSMYPEGTPGSGAVRMSFGAVKERRVGRSRLLRQFKVANASGKLRTGWEHDAMNDSLAPEFTYKVDYTLESSFQANGSYGASGSHFGYPPSASVVFTLLSQKTGEEKKIRAMQSWHFDSRESAQEINARVHLLDTAFAQKLLELNIPIELSRNSIHHTDDGATGIENIVTFLIDWAKSKGAKNMSEADELINDQILKPMGGITPVLTKVSCH